MIIWNCFSDVPFTNKELDNGDENNKESGGDEVEASESLQQHCNAKQTWQGRPEIHFM